MIPLITIYSALLHQAPATTSSGLGDPFEGHLDPLGREARQASVSVHFFFAAIGIDFKNLGWTNRYWNIDIEDIEDLWNWTCFWKCLKELGIWKCFQNCKIWEASIFEGLQGNLI